QRRMPGHVFHALAVDVDLAPVAQRFQVLGSGERALLARHETFRRLRHAPPPFPARWTGAIIAAGGPRERGSDTMIENDATVTEAVLPATCSTLRRGEHDRESHRRRRRVHQS